MESLLKAKQELIEMGVRMKRCNSHGYCCHMYPLLLTFLRPSNKSKYYQSSNVVSIGSAQLESADDDQGRERDRTSVFAHACLRYVGFDFITASTIRVPATHVTIFFVS